MNLRLLKFCWVGSAVCLFGGLVCAQTVARRTQIERLVAQAATYKSGQDMTALRDLEFLVAQSAANPGLCRQVEAGLAELTGAHCTYEARRFACKELALVGSDSSLSVIADLLKDPATVSLACLALGQRPSERANQLLREAVAGSSGLARVQVINALGDRQDLKAVLLLSKLASDEDAGAAEAAIAALGKLADKTSLGLLAGLRRHPNPVLARAAVEATLRTADRLASSGDVRSASFTYQELLEPTQAVAVRRGALAALLRLDRDGGERRIQDILRDNDPVLSPVAIAAVRALKEPGTSARFGLLLPHLTPAQQALLIAVLAARGDAAARTALTGQLSASAPEVRSAAIGALGTIGDSTTVPALVEALVKTHEAEEASAIGRALSQLGGGPRTDEALIKELRQPAPEAKVQIMAALARRNSASAATALLLESQGANAAVAKAAFRALARICPQDRLADLVKQVVTVSPDLRPDAESAAAQTLPRVGDATARSAVLLRVLDQTLAVEPRCSLLRLLPLCGDARALRALRTEYERPNPDPQIKEAALRALADWPDLAAWDLLAKTYQGATAGSEHLLALRGLVRLVADENAHPTPKLIAHYRQLLDGAKSDEDRKLILGALAGATLPEALPLAQSLTANPGTRAEAEVAVKKISASLKRP